MNILNKVCLGLLFLLLTSVLLCSVVLCNYPLLAAVIAFFAIHAAMHIEIRLCLILFLGSMLIVPLSLSLMGTAALPLSVGAIFIIALTLKWLHLHKNLNINRTSTYISLSLLAILLYSSSAFYSLFSANSTCDRALWTRSKWGVPIQHNGLLNINSQYSYDLLAKLLGANCIQSSVQIEQYNELWVITPTQPFEADDKRRILNWVARGGHLVVVSDHTDLFGHATVLNDLLRSTGISIENDVILHEAEEGGLFLSLGQLFHGLSANSCHGFGEPWLFQIGYKERTDYSGKSFFSDNQISDEDQAGVFCIGANFPCALGCITVFGDSTSFANFALSRPSSQFLLALTASSGNCFLYLLSATLLGVILLRRRLFLQGLLLICGLFLINSRLSTKNDIRYSSIPHYQISGDWRLVEGDYSLLGTVYPSAYAMTEVFPHWNGRSTHDCSLTISGKKTILEIPKERITPAENVDSLKLRLSELSSSTDLEAVIQKNEKFSWAGSFWYDDGVGPLREEAFRRTWAKLGIPCKPNFTTPCLEIDASKSIINPTCKGNNFSFTMTQLLIRDLSGNQGWVLIGASTLGKKIDEHTVLVRQIWQTPEFAFGDFVVVF